MFARSLLFLILVLTVAPCEAQRPDPDSPHVKTLQAFLRLLKQPADNIDEIAKTVLVADDFDELKRQVDAVRKNVKQVDVSDVMLENETSGKLVYELPGQVVTINFTMTADSPIRISSISADIEKNAEAVPLTWENLEEMLEQAAREGFEGAALVTRNGQQVVHKGYGFANREKQLKNSFETVFAIGSAPIDFTHAGILLLKDQGKLDLDDPITTFFSDVPADKQAITIHHLMTGRSGLPDFHDLPTDKNPDHSWIDRDEAVRRIFAQKLLFVPGQGQEHSHSAWGLLAAIMEIASGETYQQFTKERLFKPAGMTDTGFFGEPVPEERIAVGYGTQKSSEPNSPPNWGTTSWLVMGSGGQVSTLGDMLRWETAISNGKILSPESTRLYLGAGDRVSSDGDMFGFEFMHSRNPEQLFMLISNTVDSPEKRRKFRELAQRLEQLVRGPRAKFSLGIRMSVDLHEGVVIQDVLPDSAADKDGLQQGDRIVSINGSPSGDDPLKVLAPFLNSGTPIDFVVIRDGKTEKVRVTPLPRQ
jgi:CubicO group peptidase (beta-lactamase class C family)